MRGASRDAQPWPEPGAHAPCWVMRAILACPLRRMRHVSYRDAAPDAAAPTPPHTPRRADAWAWRGPDTRRHAEPRPAMAATTRGGAGQTGGDAGGTGGGSGRARLHKEY